MPDMTPVGNTVIPPNPQQGLGTLSSILGIQQQRQQLQLQAQELQRSQVQTQQAQGVNNFFSNFDYENHHGADGTLDIDSAHNSPQFQALPGVARIAVDTQLNQIKGQQLQNKQALSNLNSDVVGQFGKLAQAASDNPQNAKQMLDAFAQQGPDQARIASIYGPLLPKVPPDKLPSMLKALAAQAQDVSAQQQQTNPAITTNAASQLVGIHRATGAVSPLPGARPGSAINPASSQVAGATTAATGSAETITEDPLTHNKYVINLQTGQSRPAGQPYQGGGGAGPAPPAGASAPNMAPPQRAIGQGETEAAGAQGVAQRLQTAKASDYERPQILDALSRARAILSAPNAPDLGTSFAFKTAIKNALSGLGIDTPEAANANELVKNLAIAEATRADTSPATGKTDAGRRLIAQGSPSTHIDNKAALNIIDQITATELAGRGYIKAVGKHQGNPQAMQGAESNYLSTPNLIQAYELGLKKNKAEVDSFHQTYGLKKGDLTPSVQALKDQGAL